MSVQSAGVDGWGVRLAFRTGLAGMVLAGFVGVQAWGQATTVTPAATATPAAGGTFTPTRVSTCAKAGVDTVQTYYLANATQGSDGNELMTALRNMLPPDTKIYYVPNQGALTVCATPEVFALTQKLIHELDRPKKTYRLTYTVREMDGAKQVSTERYTMVVTSGQRTTLKQGSKVPLATGSYSTGSGGSAAGAQTQFTYIDVGMNFDATLTETGSGAQLKTKVEQSSVAEDKMIAGVQEPIIRQTTLEGMSEVVLGKTLMLGSADILGSTRRLEVEVTMEEVK